MENKKESFFKRNFNSKQAMWFGALLILIGFQNSTYFVTGIIVILGALACLSANQRKTQPSTPRFIIELLFIALIVFSVIFHNRKLLVEDPFLNLVIPAWAVISYVVKLTKKQSQID